MYNPYSLKDKTILITGASSGIGQSTAIECSKLEAKVIIVGRNKERLNETFLQLEGDGHQQFLVELKEIELLKSFVDSLPKLDGIVHSAGTTKNVPFQFATKENIDEVMLVNYYAPSEITRLALRAKKVNKNASIVFISSVSGIYSTAPASTIYSSSKGAVNGLVKGMALDLAPRGIRVNSVNPGVVETGIFDSGVITEEQLEENKKQYPLKRFGKPSDIAFSVIFLLSDASSWVTGSNLLIDGGLTLQ